MRWRPRNLLSFAISSGPDAETLPSIGPAKTHFQLLRIHYRTTGCRVLPNSPAYAADQSTKSEPPEETPPTSAAPLDSASQSSTLRHSSPLGWSTSGSPPPPPGTPRQRVSCLSFP